MGNQVHPLTLIRRHNDREASGHYRRIGEEAAAKYRDELTHIDPYERLAQVYATKAKLSDKIALVRDIVTRAVGAPEGLGDDDVLSILAAWASVEYRKYPSRDTPENGGDEEEDE